MWIKTQVLFMKKINKRQKRKIKKYLKCPKKNI